ncbi:hypothetical protein EGW08_017959 [Elysia chlorotica]|uniref:NXPE C-terminal domain-containing protein n=1 Tax=Elysia chlorotica TaxID=188477 RepID=A0A3S0ZGG4_ELYCH|nr:hypothetical protein EGW08_017959 [Elysia chlorotica]
MKRWKRIGLIGVAVIVLVLLISRKPDKGRNAPKSSKIQNCFGRAKQTDLNLQLIKTCGILDEDFLRTPPHTASYDFEKRYLSQPPAQSLDGVTSLDKTLVELVNMSGRPEAQVGENVTVRVEARDGLGRPKTIGGDEVWVWFVDTSGKGAITASVRDLDNGTYIASTVLRWTGTYRVNVAIAYPREYLRAFIHTHLVIKQTRLFLGHFANGEVSVQRMLIDSLKISHAAHLVKVKLTLLVTDPGWGLRKIEHALPALAPVTGGAPEDVSASLGLEKQKYPKPCGGLNPCPFCNEVAGRLTWDRDQPTGYLYKDVWHPLHCQVHAFTKQQCFNNTQWVLLGDSNLRSLYQSLMKQSGAASVQRALTKKWHRPMSGRSSTLKFGIRWAPHSQHFLNGALLAELGSLEPSSAVIDSLSSEGRHVIVLNHFYHLSSAHISSLHVKLLAIKAALVRLFARNRHAIALIQGPYISWRGWSEHFGAGDMLGRHMIQLEHQVFSEPALRDRVLYIPAWDITQAVENVDFHPAKSWIITALIQSYACGRFDS